MSGLKTDNDKLRDEGARELLQYLISVAQQTCCAEVWRALFAEILESLDE